MHQKSWDGAVIVVEDRAHLREGHFPNRFAELADGFVDAGAHVEALTSLGWVLADGNPRGRKSWQYGPVASCLFRLSEKLGGRTNAYLSSLARALRAWILVHQASRIARACPKQPAAVVVVSYKLSIATMALLAGRRPFVVRQFGPHASFPLIVRAAQRVRAFLGISKPALILAVPDGAWTPGVGKPLPSIAIEQLPLAGIRPIARESRK